jgi:two-component system LytT family response regulator
MQALRVLIADDEEIARRRLARLLALIPGVSVCGECQDGEEVLRRVKAGGVDVLLLDIQMPGLSGLEAIGLLPEDGPYVIFCTAHAEHAVQAFEVGAVDYLLKPIEPARLQKALDRARSREAVRAFHEAARRHRAEPPAAAALRRLAVPTRQGIVLLDPREISHAVLEGELVTIHAGGATVITDDSLQDLQAKLPAAAFERVHRRALLNLEHVARLEPSDSGGFVARTHRGQAVEISRQAARDLRKRLGLRKAPEDENA